MRERERERERERGRVREREREKGVNGRNGRESKIKRGGERRESVRICQKGIKGMVVISHQKEGRN